MTAALVRLAVRVYPRRRKDPLPTPASHGGLVFASQRIWPFDETGSLLQISGVRALHPEGVVFDRLAPLPARAPDFVFYGPQPRDRRGNLVPVQVPAGAERSRVDVA